MFLPSRDFCSLFELDALEIVHHVYSVLELLYQSTACTQEAGWFRMIENASKNDEMIKNGSVE